MPQPLTFELFRKKFERCFLFQLKAKSSQMEPEKLEIMPLDFTLRLPDSLVHHIFSFLSPRDVANASVLSKNWNRAWLTYSCVAFHFIYSDDVAEQDQLSDDLHIQSRKQDFLSVMQKAIHRRLEQKFHIQRFQMYIDFPDIDFLAPYTDQWIGKAVSRSASELALRVDSLSGRHRSHYAIPQFVLLAHSLKVLSLSGCAFVNGFDFKLPNLQKLSLSHCSFPDEFAFQKIISGCPMIECVKVSFCKSVGPHLVVKGLSRLKCFEFLLCNSVTNVEVHASTLHKFFFASSVHGWPRSIDLSPCMALRELKLTGGGFLVEFIPQTLISQLPALEILELYKCLGSQGFKISSQKLKRLTFKECRHLSGSEIDTPNLQSLEYYNCDEPFFPVNASRDIKVHLIFSLRGNSVDLLIRLKDFISKLSCCEELKLVLYQESKEMIVHEKVSKVSFSSLCHFMYPKWICISSRSYTDLVNELFPIVYPETLFVIHSRGGLVELISEGMKNLQGHPNLWHKLVDFDVGSYEDEEHQSCLATDVFIKAHSCTTYQTSKIILNWKYNVSNYRVTF